MARVHVSYKTEEILVNWVNKNLKPVLPCFNYNPKNLQELILDRTLCTHTKVFGRGSQNTIFSRHSTMWYMRAWHDSVHIKYGLEFTEEDELKVAELQFEEAIQMGIDTADARLLSLDIELHIKHYHKHKTHPEYQSDMIADYLLYGECILEKNYGLPDDRLVTTTDTKEP